METMHEVISPVSPGLYLHHFEESRQRREGIGWEVEQELATLREWEKVQEVLFTYLFSQQVEHTSWSERIEHAVSQCTGGQARIWWEPLSKACMIEGGHFVEIRYQHIRYGMVQFKSGYLISHLAPHIHQMFGNLCALAIHLAEHKVLVGLLLKPLQPLSEYETLTSREKEVLECMALGDNECTIARRLCIAPTTVRTHRHSIYSRLNVHTPQETILRSFALRLLDWLHLSKTSSSEA